MLIYHPAYDAYHCAFRELIVAEALKSLELTKLQILDFYLVFPAEIRNIRLPRGHGKKKKLAEGLANKYHGPVNPLQTFRDMKHIQLAAMRALAATGLLVQKSLELGVIERSSKVLPPDLQERVNHAMERNVELVNYVLFELGKMPANGFDGLKHRTGLMEYRYDVT